MPVLRLFLLLVVLVLAISAALYLLTRQARYRDLFRQTLRFSLLVGLVLAVLLLVERMALVGWGVLL